MDIEELSVFGLYSQKENKVTAALLQLINSGGVNLLRLFISNFAYFLLPIILLLKYQLRCREPVTQPNCRIYMYNLYS